MKDSLKITEYLSFKDEPNPYVVLATTETATDREIYQAYQKALAANRQPSEQIRKAYHKVNSKQKRTKLRLLSPLVPESAWDIVTKIPPKPLYLGPGKWFSLFLSNCNGKNQQL